MEKNIFLLKTKGLDRNRGALFADSLEDGKLVKNFYDSNIEWKDCAYYHIYIISNEEIKIGDWYFDITLEQIVKANVNSDHNIYIGSCKKIILTTDPDLIKDGVQAIDDEFLDFFVENPTFESIVVERLLEIGNLTQLGEIFDITESWKLKGRTLYYCGESKTKGIWKLEEELTVNKFNNIYRIIIPKVDFSFFEGKSLFFNTQETAKGCTCDDSPDLCDYCEDAQILKEAREQAMGKKSLEEAARVYENSFNDASGTESTDFIEGAKWQAEQLFKDDAIQTLNAGMSLLLKKIEKMYSQEEVSDLIEDWTKMASGLNMNFPRRKFNNWFEQFKKK
jgi:hypothetical protein